MANRRRTPRQAQARMQRRATSARAIDKAPRRKFPAKLRAALSDEAANAQNDGAGHRWRATTSESRAEYEAALQPRILPSRRTTDQLLATLSVAHQRETHQ